MALQRALGPWEAGFPLDDLTVLWDKEGMLRQGQEGGKGQEATGKVGWMAVGKA